MEILLKIEDMDLESLNGMMAENMKAFGKMENNMDREFIKMLRGDNKKVNGMMGRELNGLIELLLEAE